MAGKVDICQIDKREVISEFFINSDDRGILPKYLIEKLTKFTYSFTSFNCGRNFPQILQEFPSELGQADGFSYLSQKLKMTQIN